jgi:hypothetical protein
MATQEQIDMLISAAAEDRQWHISNKPPSPQQILDTIDEWNKTTIERAPKQQTNKARTTDAHHANDVT